MQDGHSIFFQNYFLYMRLRCREVYRFFELEIFSSVINALKSECIRLFIAPILRKVELCKDVCSHAKEMGSESVYTFCNFC